MSTRFDQTYTQHLAGESDEDNPPANRFTQSTAQLMGKRSLDRVRLRVTQNYVQMIAKREQGDVGNRFTQTYSQIMMHLPPNFAWIDDMFVNEVFPYDISFNSIGATKFATDVIITDSGNDQRLSRWEQPLMEYDVAYGVRTMEHLHGLISFFRAMRGRKYGFLYKDEVDHTSTLATRVEARAPDAISPFDQFLGVAESRKFQFQLRKEYPADLLNAGGTTFYRPIQKPVPGTVRMAWDSTEMTNWIIDNNTGIVQFLPLKTLTPAQTGSLNITRLQQTQSVVFGPPGLFLNWNVNDEIVMSGWAEGKNNIGLGSRTWINSKLPDHSRIEVLSLDADWQTETNRTGVTIQQHPAPPAGTVIRAGFEFWVPVRFDTDRLPVTLEEYGIGGAADVKLIELRPAEALV